MEEGEGPGSAHYLDSLTQPAYNKSQSEQSARALDWALSTRTECEDAQVKFIEIDGRTIQESALYCRSTPGAMDVEYYLTPEPHTRRVDGLKERLIIEPHKPRPTRLHVPDRQSPHVVSLNARETLDAFFEALAPSLRPAIEGRSLVLTYPAMADASHREDYRKRVQDAAHRHFKPLDIAFIEESDAVVEFLLHAGRGMELPNRDQLIPVLDWGSLTCNVALVVPILAGGRTSDVTTGDRPSALATTADCARDSGGARIDQMLLQEIVGDRYACPEQVRNALLPIIEELKVRVSRERRPVEVELDVEGLYSDCELTFPPSQPKVWKLLLTPHMLREKVEDIWHRQIRPVLDRVLETAWKNLRGRRRERLARLEIKRPEDLKLIVEQIVLSGGSSNLPGVADLAAQYYDVKRERIIEVGRDYVVAVAVGAAAWRANQLKVLETTHEISPMRLLPRPEKDLYLVGKNSSSVRVYQPAVIVRDQWEEYIGQPHEQELSPRIRFSHNQYAVAEGDSQILESQNVEATCDVLLHPSQPWDNLGKAIKQQYSHKGARGGWASCVDPSSGQITVELRHQRSETSKILRQSIHRFTDNCLTHSTSHTDSHPSSKSDLSNQSTGRAFGQSAAQPQVVLDFGNSKTVVVSLDNEKSLLLDELPTRQDPPAELLEYAVFDGRRALPPPLQVTLSPERTKSNPVSDTIPVPPPITRLDVDTPPVELGEPSPGLAAPTEYISSTSPNELVTHSEAIEHLIAFTSQRGMVLDHSIIKALYLALVVRPFAVMAGPSGVGKSRLARLYAEAFAAVSNGHRVAVEPSWLSSDTLIPATGWAEIYKRVSLSSKLVVTVLDEFNLAPPERYLAQVLSACEDDGILKVVDTGDLNLPQDGSLKLIGTVNIDESTHTLSDKVLDRFSVIELEPYIPRDIFPLIGDVVVAPRPLAQHLLNAFKVEERVPIPTSVQAVWALLAGRAEGLTLAEAASIASLGLGLGYRLAVDVCRFTQIAVNHRIFSEIEALDIALSSRVLPRLRGDRRLEPVLTRLLAIAKESNYKRMHQRLGVMLERLKQDRYSSYWS